MRNADVIESEHDVVVVGAGPGGIAAAVTSAAAGRSVALIDDAPQAGGQIWRNRGETPASSGAAQWMSRLTAERAIGRFRSTRIVALPEPHVLLAEGPDGQPRRIRFASLILATGARERFVPFPGWTLPGVVGAGGFQALVKTGLEIAGKRVVIAGTGPLLFAVADLARAKGARVPLIIEQASGASVRRFGQSLVRSPAKLWMAVTMRARLFRTRYATDSLPVSVARGPGGLRVTYQRVGGATAEIDCDYLACGFNLVPNLELPRVLGCELTESAFVKVDEQCRSSVPNVYAIGELTGIGGVEKALLEGQIAGHAVVGQTDAFRSLSRRHRAALAFTRRLDEAFALRPEVASLTTPKTVVCRCEDVSLQSVAAAMSARDAKLQTRCGMGPCQGRVCGPALQLLLGKEPPQVRPPIFVTSLRTLAAASPTDKPPVAPPA